MVGSEVDHKYLGVHAKATLALNNPGLSNGLYKLLGLSTLLSRKLLRARKQRKLDPTRTTKSLDLYRHIIWMSREGLNILTAEVLPHLRAGGAKVDKELQVLGLKMNASFLHIFVLFDYTYITKAPGAGSSPGLEAYAYMAPTIQAFAQADAAATRLLPASHPLRLSTKLEYSAFTYDCARDFTSSRRIAQSAIEEALGKGNTVCDEYFDDAMDSLKWWVH